MPKGIKMSLEQRKKLSDSHKGKIPSKETLLKRSISLKKCWENTEYREKISQIRKNTWKNPDHKIKFKKTCSNRGLGKKEIFACCNCNKEFIAYPKHRKSIYKFCSNSCKAKYLTGGQFKNNREHPFWKGGDTRKYLYDWSYVSFKIKERDNFCCNLCKSKEKLETHHIDENKHNNTDYNLITLCKSCHTKITFNFIKHDFIFYEIEVPILKNKIEESITNLINLNNEKKNEFEILKNNLVKNNDKF